MFTPVLFITVKMWKQPKCSSTDKWIKEKWCVHAMEYYSGIKVDEIRI